MKTKFTTGDKVKLKQNFFGEPVFKSSANTRDFRKQIADCRGMTLTIIGTCDGSLCDNFACEEFPNKHFPADCFELVPVEPKIGTWAVPLIEKSDFSCMPARLHKGKPFKIAWVYTGLVTGQVYLSEGIALPGILLSQCKLLPNYSPKRQWTEEEIAEAKIIAYECIFNRKTAPLGITNYPDKPFIVRTFSGGIFSSHPCNTDEPNEHIGRMVTLCKATGRALPDWIKKEGKTK